MENNRAQWGSKIGFILAAAGSAVGLGNIWKFPGKAFEGGGGAYILIYLAIVVLIGFPVMLSELTIGRAAQANAIDSFHKLGYRGFKWVGVTGVAVAFIVTSYYCHVGGWVLRYVVSYITEAQTVYADPLGYFYGLLGYNAATGETWFPLTAILFAAVFMAVNAFIIIKGVEGGIEKFNKVGMPALFVILIVLLARTITLDGAQVGFAYMLSCDWSKVGFNTFLSALGQAFFSLSLGMAIMITYGSYVKPEVDLNKSVSQVEFFDTGVALLAGVMIIPAVFVFSGTDGMGVGPSLMFVSLPKVFDAMGPAGTVVGVLFFISAIFATLTSCISVLESIVANCMEIFHTDRKKTTLVLALIYLAASAVIALGYSVFYFNVTLPNGSSAQLLDIMDYVSNSVMMPLIALLSTILIGWVKSPKYVADEMERGGYKFRRKRMYYVMIRYVAPVMMLVLFLQSTGLLSMIFK